MAELIWRKSRSCANSTCIEVARDEALFLVRDSKHPDGARLAFDQGAWSSFVVALRGGADGLKGIER